MCIRDRTITMEFLVAHGLPFTMLIGCDMLRKYSAIIDMSRAKVTLDSNCINWTAKLIESESALSDRTVYNVQEVRNHRWHMPSNNVFYESDDDQLWREKLQEVHTFKHDKTNAPITDTQVETLIGIYNEYRHVFSESPGKVENYQCTIRFKMCIRDRFCHPEANFIKLKVSCYSF